MVSRSIPRLDLVTQSVAISGFTDDQRDSGHIDLTDLIPDGSCVLFWKADVTTRFTGGLSDRTTLEVGTPGDPLAFCANGAKYLQRGTSSALGDVPLPTEAVDDIGVDRTVRVTVRDPNDFGNITGGAFTISVYFVRTNV